MQLVKVYESVTEVMNENKDIKRPSINKAIQENTKVFLRKFYPDLDRYVRKFINLCFKIDSVKL